MTKVPVARRACDLLALAAAPGFLTMALMTGSLGPAAVACAGGHHASPMTGMAMMYFLTSASHASPWARLVSKRLAD